MGEGESSGLVARAVGYFRSLLRKLVELRDTPHAIAGGVAWGIFFGMTPLFGLKTLACLLGAWLSRCSKLAAVIAVSLTDVVTPFWPVILRIQYDIGYWLLSQPHRFPPKMDMHSMKVGELLKWTTFFDVGLPMLVGGAIMALPLALVAYAITYFLLRSRANRPLSPTA